MRRGDRGLRRLGFVVAATAALLGSAAAGTAAADPTATVGTLHSWGENTLGQQGGNGLTGVVAVAGGRDHALALTPAGTVLAWGDNSNGAVGDGSTVPVRAAPVAVPGLSGVAAVAAGHYHSLALLSNGTAKAWGLGTSGQLGNGTFATKRSPVTVMLTKTTVLNDVTKLAGGRAHSLAIRDGHVYAWGDNTSGQLGDGTKTNRAYPVPVTIPVTVVDVAGGRDHSLAVGSDGSLWAWGDNTYGQLGTGDTLIRTRPTKLKLPTGVRAVDVEAGAFHSLVRTSTGTVFAWGRDNFGQLGVGSTAAKKTPTAVPGLSGIVEIVCGRDHAAAVRADHSVVAWGKNDAGQLDDGTTTNRTSPVPMLGATGAVGLAAGRGYTIVLSTTG